MINWKTRFKNKLFWLAMIPLCLLLIQQVAGLFGIVIDLSELGEKLKAIVETVFMILAVLGIVIDPTTKGVADSPMAMTYDEPKSID